APAKRGAMSTIRWKSRSLDRREARKGVAGSFGFLFVRYAMSKQTLPDSTLITAPYWRTLDLVRRLKSPYSHRIQTVYNFIKPLAAIRPLGNEEFTDHDLAHSTRVVERIGKLLPKSAKLNQPELYILLLAALLHDFGMWVARSEVAKLWDDEEFLDYCQRH